MCSDKRVPGQKRGDRRGTFPDWDSLVKKETAKDKHKKDEGRHEKMER